MASELGGSSAAGLTGYKKYLSGKTNLKLKTKVSNKIKTKFPDKVALTQKIGTTTKEFYIPADDTVIFDCRFFGNNQSNTHYQVEYKKKLYFIHFSNLVKPGKEHVVSLKPQTLKIKTKYKSTAALVEDIMVGLQSVQSKIPTETFNYLELLVRYFWELENNKPALASKTLKSIDANWPAIKNIIDQASITKDFAEMLGPLFVLYDRKLKKLHGTLAEIEFPAEGNYPLIDFLIYYKRPGAKELVIKKYSSKSSFSSSANTVKFTTVYKEALNFQGGRKTDFFKSWGNHWIWKMLEAMNGFVESKRPMKECNQSIRRWVEQNKLISASETKNMSDIQFWTAFSNKHDADLKDFFVSFMLKAIYYVVFNINQQNGAPIFILDIDSLKKVKVKVKENSAESTSTRSHEQIGFDVKFV